MQKTWKVPPVAVQEQAHWKLLLVQHQTNVTATLEPENFAAMVGYALMVASFEPVVEVERMPAEMTESLPAESASVVITSV